jgi:hypothetical protein
MVRLALVAADAADVVVATVPVNRRVAAAVAPVSRMDALRLGIDPMVTCLSMSTMATP